MNDPAAADPPRAPGAPDAPHSPRPATPASPLREVAALFLRLGLTAFGGPLAHIAMMQKECVERGWITREEFVDLVGVTNLLPGPNSTEMAIHLGHRRAGRAGLLVAGACFIFPAALLTAALAWIYVRFGKLPETAAILYGTKPVIVAIVVQALVTLTRTAVKRASLAILAAIAAAAVAFGLNEIAVLFAIGLIASALGDGEPRAASGSGAPSSSPRGTPPASDTGTTNPTKTSKSGSFLLATAASATGAAPLAASFGLLPLFLVFAKIGSILFGSGYVLLAFLRADLVERLGWMTEAQLLDAVTAGQITPGPVFTTATFIGYLLGGGPGAIVATLGIFAPAFLFVAASGPLVRAIRRSKRAGAFLDGVNVASLAMMAVVAARLGRAAITDPVTLALAAATLAILLKYKPNATWLVLAGALAGLAVKTFSP